MINTKTKRNSGFVALISAIIISAILLLIATNLSLTAFYNRSEILDSELKERSSALAEACVDAAILKLSNNISYTPNPAFNFSTETGGEVVLVNSDQCKIVSIDTTGSHIKTQAQFGNSFTNLRIIINTATFAIQSWEECSVLTSSTSGC